LIVAWIVRPLVHQNGSFVSDAVAPDYPGARPYPELPRLYREDDLPLADFAHSFWGFGVLVLVERAVEFLDQPGVVRLGTVEGREVVQIVLQLDLLDRVRSVDEGYGYVGYHLIDQADGIAGRSIFQLPHPDSAVLFCGDEWKQAYDDNGFTGLSFELAVVG
jgi:hypothetical protein